ncbi:pinensin family lanthipeptide [Fulvivirga kasyanovii]|nr:pinensin family lanthipeptide [Fulvivirga kasyanovii]
MKKKKLTLKELKVTSLITSVTPIGNEAETVKGGAEVPKTAICTVSNTFP